MPAVLLFLFTEHERVILQALALLALGNPFLARRIELERIVLGDQFVSPGPFMSAGIDPRKTHANIALITALIRRMMPVVRDRYKALVKAGVQPSAADRAIYLASCLYFLYDSYDERLQGLIDRKSCEAPFYDDYALDYAAYLGFLPKAADLPDVVRLFEVMFQIRRAFHHIYVNLRGVSFPIARLRARVWDAIFGGPLDEYGLHQWNRRHLISTLIHGPSGTGKELAAKAIARSGYVPFATATNTFAAYNNYYAGLNLIAFSQGLLESELYGHVKGAFTGAGRDKKGVLQQVPRFGCVLLDEAGAIGGPLQAQLLRLLQERTFRRVGDEGPEIALEARILTATHGDLAALLAVGTLREDFYRRICMFKVVTPSLRERLDDSPGELRELLRVVSEDLFGAEPTDALIDKVEAWILTKLPRHPWTGNMREMGQCVVEVKAGDEYHPEQPDPAVALALALRDVRAPMAEVVRNYAELAMAKAGSRAEAARLLEMDPRRLQGILGPAAKPRGKPRG